jgi:hypothetical protein
MGIFDLVCAFNDTQDAAKKIHEAISQDQELVISEFFIDGRLPITYAYDKAIDPDLLPPDCSESNSPGWFAERSRVIGPVGTSEIHFSVYNRGSRTASIRGIGVTKARVLDLQVNGSMTFVPDGGCFHAPVRLYCLLDSNQNTMIEGYYDEPEDRRHHEDFFRHGRVEIDPGHTADIIVTLVAKRNAYRCSLYLRAESPKIGMYTLEPENNTSVTVVPESFVPKDQRFMPSFRQSPPYVMPCRH